MVLSKEKGLMKRPIQRIQSWIRRQPPKMQVFLALMAGAVSLVFLWLVVHNHDNLFVAAEIVHFAGISVLIYKLTKEKSCTGLSLRSQELTVLFLAVRLYCSLVMETDIHTVLDSLTLVTTIWVVYMMRFNLKSTYSADKDTVPLYYVAVPCAVLALLIRPKTRHLVFNRICWAFCTYLEAVSVFPQLRMMQKTKIIEPFTAHYVFALGIARFLSCAHWIFQLVKGRLLVIVFYGLWWPCMVVLSEIIQTFILSDFCYYYIKSMLDGQLIVRLPSGVV